MSKKNDEGIIGEIFIKEYNAFNSCHFRLDYEYLSGRDENDFPDLKFINGKELYAEVVRAVSEKIERMKNNHNNLELIEVYPHSELFLSIDKKEAKNYSGAENIILIIHLPFYFEDTDVISLATPIKDAGYNFMEIWAVWDEDIKRPIKLA